MKTDKEFLSGVYEKATSYKQNEPEWFKSEDDSSYNLLTNKKVKKITSLVSSAAAVVLLVGGVLVYQNSVNNVEPNSPYSLSEARAINQIEQKEVALFNSCDVVVIIEHDKTQNENVVKRTLKTKKEVTGWEKTLYNLDCDKEKQSIVFLKKEKNDYNVCKMSTVLVDNNNRSYYVDENNTFIYISEMGQ